MFAQLTIASAILSLASTTPVKNAILPRQASAPIYPENGTLTDPPLVTNLTRPNPSYTDEQLTALKTAYTTAEKIGLLASYGSPNDYFKFDLTPNGSASNAANGLGGQGYLAFVQNYPVLIGTGVSVAIGYLNPCGLDSIHLHNRADELVTLVKGTSLKTGFVLEDGYGTSPIPPLPSSLTIPQINPSTPKSASTKPPSAPRALSTGNSTTTATPRSSSLP